MVVLQWLGPVITNWAIPVMILLLEPIQLIFQTVGQELSLLLTTQMPTMLSLNNLNQILPRLIVVDL